MPITTRETTNGEINCRSYESDVRCWDINNTHNYFSEIRKFDPEWTEYMAQHINKKQKFGMCGRESAPIGRVTFGRSITVSVLVEMLH